MFFKKKKVVEPEITEVVEQVTEESKPRDAIEEWGTNGRAVVNGYVIKAFRMWNFNHSNNPIQDGELDKLLIGLQMAFTSTTPQKAVSLYEEYNNAKGE